MSYLISERSTLKADRTDIVDDTGAARIIPNVLYPAWSGLLTQSTDTSTFTDSSTTAHTITPAGVGIHHSGARKKFGSTSLRFNGIDDTLEVADHADWDMGSGDYTIEFWLNDVNVKSNDGLIGNQTSAGYSGWLIRNQSNELNFNSWDGSSVEVNFSTSGFSWNAGASGTWRHIALVKIGTTYHFYINGTSGGNVTDSSPSSLSTSSSALKIGRVYANFAECYMEDIRITKGLGVYTGNFTAPTGTLSTTWSANPFGGSNTAANSTASNVKLLIHSDNASAVHSGDYGTVQSDGKMYYYTDIKGSKPIKDPRIGARYGSQRFSMRSQQLLEQETALEGQDVYSIDGREWMRLNDMGQGVAYGNNPDGGDGVLWEMNGNGAYFEVTGYFNAANVLWFPHTSGDDFYWTLDGDHSGYVASGCTITHLLGNRFVNTGAVYNLPFSPLLTTPGIHTIKLVNTSSDFVVDGFELFAQDTTSTATRAQIQIPQQTVITQSRKRTIGGTPRYNPFDQAQDGTAVTINSSTTNTAKLTGGWSGTGSTYYSSELHTPTSMGLSAWESGGEYFRPVNGGRVVWWVNGSGALQCSVNMMPPAGTARDGVTAGHNVPTGVHNWATAYKPALHSTTLDHTQAEIAKEFYWREFGNGAANQGTAAGTSADASMLFSAADDISFIMDDGLTSLSGAGLKEGYGGSDAVDVLYRGSTSAFMDLVFIGTGISKVGKSTSMCGIAQNLPYGTHVFGQVMNGSNTDSVWYLDGIQLETVDSSGAPRGDEFLDYLSISQPKMPLIPSDAVVIADYMLMADFVQRTTADTKREVSKGVRLCNATRDTFFLGAASSTGISIPYAGTDSFQKVNVYHDGAAAGANITAFAANYGLHYWGSTNRATDIDVKLDGSTFTYDTANIYDTDDEWNDVADDGSMSKHNGLSSNLFGIKNQVLGLHTYGDQKPSGSGYNVWNAWEIATPIHTSSHYQSFETPYLHELVGGDRNIESTNLVVTTDGKTWDELRDTSYLNNIVLATGEIAADISVTSTISGITETRGQIAASSRWSCIQKDSWAIAYDMYQCLKPGVYQCELWFMSNTTDTAGRLLVNRKDYSDAGGFYWNTKNNNEMTSYTFPPLTMNRGDYLYFLREGGTIEGVDGHNGIKFQITKLNNIKYKKNVVTSHNQN